MQATTVHDREVVEAIRSERFRFFHANRWGAPVGTIFAVSLYSAVVAAADQVPRGLTWWAVGMFGVMIVQFAAVMVPTECEQGAGLRLRQGPRLPRLRRSASAGRTPRGSDR